MERFPLDDPSRVSAARREAVRIAAGKGFDAEDQGRLAIVVTELSTNVLRHAGRGEMLLRATEGAEGPCLDALWLDRGPGMSDPAGCRRDGYSTAGTPGTGLGAAARQSDAFDLYTQAGKGTAVFARLRPRRRAPPVRRPDDRRWAIGAIAAARAGEEVCGDAWSVRCRDGRLHCLVADGLGHGPLAAAASTAAVSLFERDPLCDPRATAERIHLGLRATRGAAMAVAAIDPARRVVDYCGIGNIAGVVIGGETRRMVSHSGTAGALAPRIRAFEYSYVPPSVVILCSDGLATSWRPESYPGLMACDPMLIAGVLFRDLERGRDDATILVVKELRP